MPQKPSQRSCFPRRLVRSATCLTAAALGLFILKPLSVSRYVAAHVPACALVASGFVESIIFHLDSADRVIAFEYVLHAATHQFYAGCRALFLVLTCRDLTVCAARAVVPRYANEIPAASDPRCTDSSGAYTKIKSRGVVSSLTSSKLPVAIEGNLFYNAPPGSAQAAASGAAGGSGGNAAPAEEPSFFQKYKWSVDKRGNFCQ